MKILITGIGCIGKSTLREKLATDFPNNVISVDMDYDKVIPSEIDKVVIVESVHGLEENPQMFDKILYPLPPRSHITLWLMRAWVWFATGIVDLSAPKGKRKQFAIPNIPIILKIILRNFYMRKKWINNDLKLIQRDLKEKTYIAFSMNHGYERITEWITNYI